MSGRKAGCNLSSLAPIKPMMCSFQSPSCQKAGCNCAAWGVGAVAIRVSILIRPSSGQKAGCNPITRRPTLRSKPFQSSSGQKAGCNPPGPSPLGSTAVSILIWPEGRMQYDNPPPHAPVKAVSILIRPEGRMQPLPSGVTALGWHLFQSSSGQKAGCNRHHGPGHHRAERVSILIRPSGRMQPWRATMLATIHSLFQSSSGQKAGCNQRRC